MTADDHTANDHEDRHPLDEVERTTTPNENGLDELWAQYLRLLDAGQEPDIEQLCGGAEGLADALRELVETSSWVNDWIDDEATTLPPRTADETYPFVVEASIGETVGSLAQLIDQVVDSSACPFGEYELIELVGRGGMGVVFRARQRAIGREVAVKMIAAGRFASRPDIERFYAEARAASTVRHANIVTIYQVGEIDGHHFFSMDFISGTDLAEKIRSGPLPSRESAQLMVRVADAVQTAHTHGVIHRDLKPANILVAENGEPHVTDFGLAKLFDHDGDLTATGNAMGTPGYMPPEQAKGEWDTVGESSDVYSLGAVLYATLTGQAPFKSQNPLDTMYSVVHERPVRPQTLNPGCDPQLATIALKCLEKDPTRRYGTAGDLAADLQRYLDGTPLEAQPMSPIRRCGCWCAGIPLVAALTGGAVRESTHGQQRAQAGIVLVAMGILVWLTLLWRVPQRSMPSTIRIAGGEQGGVYIDFANKLKSALESSLNVPVVVTESQGSGDSVNQLYDDRVDLAIVQAAAVDGNVHAIVSPLHYEYVHVIARKDLEAKTIRDLNGRRVGLGKPLTGSRLSANALVRHYGIETDANCRDANWKELRDGKLDATIVTAGLENRAIHELLNSGDFILLTLPRAADIGDFNSSSIEFPADVYGAVTSNGIPTVRTPAFLVTHDDASPELVKATLKVLYDTPSLKVFSKEEAETLNLIKWHVTARQFFHPTAE